MAGRACAAIHNTINDIFYLPNKKKNIMKYAKLVSNSFLLSLGAADHALDFIIFARVRPFFPLGHFFEHEFNLRAPLPARYVHLIDDCQGDNSQLIDVPYKL